MPCESCRSLQRPDITLADMYTQSLTFIGKLFHPRYSRPCFSGISKIIVFILESLPAQSGDCRKTSDRNPHEANKCLPEQCQCFPQAMLRAPSWTSEVERIKCILKDTPEVCFAVVECDGCEFRGSRLRLIVVIGEH